MNNLSDDLLQHIFEISGRDLNMMSSARQASSIFHRIYIPLISEKQLFLKYLLPENAFVTDEEINIEYYEDERKFYNSLLRCIQTCTNEVKSMICIRLELEHRTSKLKLPRQLNEALWNVLSKLSNLHLRLNMPHIVYEIVKCIPAHIKSLSLSETQITEEFIALASRKWICLESLDLSFTDLHCLNEKTIKTGLSRIITIKSLANLNLSCNTLRNNLNGLNYTSNITSLNIGSNRIQDNGAKMISNSIKKWKNLKSLTINDNPGISTSGIDTILSSILMLKSFEYLDLSGIDLNGSTLLLRVCEKHFPRTNLLYTNLESSVLNTLFSLKGFVMTCGNQKFVNIHLRSVRKEDFECMFFDASFGSIEKITVEGNINRSYFKKEIEELRKQLEMKS